MASKDINGSTVQTLVLNRFAEGICAMTGKTGEVFEIRIGDGDTQTISASKLIEVLRLSCSIRIAHESSTSEGVKHANAH